MVKLQHDLNKQYKLTLPKALVEAIGWGKGTNIRVGLDDKGNIILSRQGCKGNEASEEDGSASENEQMDREVKY
ncbi:MAG: hypothetical protein R6U32_00240 [Candidatus Woesearchaeota archaeon]